MTLSDWITANCTELSDFTQGDSASLVAQAYLRDINSPGDAGTTATIVQHLEALGKAIVKEDSTILRLSWRLRTRIK